MDNTYVLYCKYYLLGEGSDSERQESTPMEILRIREESHAWTQWQEVLAQCSSVSDTHKENEKNEREEE